MTIQPIPHQLNSPSVESISLQFEEKDAVGLLSKALQKSRKVTALTLPLATDVVAPSQMASNLAEQESPLVFWNHLPIFHISQLKGFSSSGPYIGDVSIQAPSAE